MRRYALFLILFFGFLLQAEPYKPYPILFVHGLASNSGAWGASTKDPKNDRSEWICKDSVDNHPEGTYANFLPLMTPYAWAWYDYGDTTYTPDTIGVIDYTKDRFPNKAFLEVVNMDDNVGSVDEDYYYSSQGYNSPQNGYVSWRDELEHIIDNVLEEYYGSDWIDNPDAKIILIGHSTAGAAMRLYVKRKLDEGLDPHISKIITVDAVNNGTDFTYLEDYLIPFLETAATFAPSGISAIISNLIALGVIYVSTKIDIAYTETTHDLHHNSTVYNELNSGADELVNSGIKWYSLIGRRPYPEIIEPLCAYLDQQGAGLITLGILTGNADAIYWGSYLVVLATGVFWWEWNSDLLVETSSQNLNKVDPRYNAETVELEPLLHFDATKKWQVFRNFLEDPPVIYIDSLVTMSGNVVNIPKPEKFGASEGISRILGRVYDYFLANVSFQYSINYGDWQELNWMNDFGYEGNKFHIENLDTVFHYGTNSLRFMAVNVENYTLLEEHSVVISMGPTVLEVYPQRRDALKGDNSIDVEAMYKDTSGLSACSLEVTSFDGNVWNYGETVLADSAVLTLTIPSGLPEGEYRVNASAINTKSQRSSNDWNFFIDRTPPVVEIKEVEGEVYSARVMENMPIKYRLDDNFAIYLPYPQWLHLAILRGDNLIWEDTVSASYGGDRVARWDFTGEEGSGEYTLILETMDKAGNVGCDTVSFYLDNEPPVISVIFPIDSVLNAEKEYIFLKYLTDEDCRVEYRLVNILDGSEYQRGGYAFYDMDKDSVQDTSYVYEGAGGYGQYLPDGIYTIKFTVKDNVGNADTLITGLIAGDTLRVDRTPPVIKQMFVQPLVVGDDGITHLLFTLSEENDIPENKGDVKVKIYCDTIVLSDTLFTSIPDAGTSYSREISLVGLPFGRHTIKVEAEDRWGNILSTGREVVYRTFGTEIRFPLSDMNIPKGRITIKGIANDPDEYNQIPFEGFYFSWKASSSGLWNTSNIEVSEKWRRSGTPLYKGDISVNIEDILAVWDVSSFSLGDYALRLVSKEETGDSLVDSVHIYITDDTLIPPVITLSTAIYGDGDSYFEPALGESVGIEFSLGGRLSDVVIGAYNPAGRELFSQKYTNVIPDGIPNIEDTGKVYLFRDGDSLYLIYYGYSIFPVSFDIYTIDKPSLEVDTTIGDSASLTVLPEHIQYNTFSLDTTWSVNTRGLIFKAEGKIRIEVNVGSGVEEILVGPQKDAVSSFVFQCPPASFWYGYENWGYATGGKYRIIASAYGVDGTGVDADEDTVIIMPNVEIEQNLTSDKVYPYLSPPVPAGMEYKVNTKSYVKVEVCKDNTSLLTLKENLVNGGIWFSVSWNGLVGSEIAPLGNDYRFRIRAYSYPDSLDSADVYTDYFSVCAVSDTGKGNFYVNPRYFTDYIHGDSVFNGKNEFLWEVTAEGGIYPSQNYGFRVYAHSVEDKEIHWTVMACSLEIPQPQTVSATLPASGGWISPINGVVTISNNPYSSNPSITFNTSTGVTYYQNKVSKTEWEYDDVAGWVSTDWYAAVINPGQIQISYWTNDPNFSLQNVGISYTLTSNDTLLVPTSTQEGTDRAYYGTWTQIASFGLSSSGIADSMFVAIANGKQAITHGTQPFDTIWVEDSLGIWFTIGASQGVWAKNTSIWNNYYDYHGTCEYEDGAYTSNTIDATITPPPLVHTPLSYDSLKKVLGQDCIQVDWDDYTNHKVAVCVDTTLLNPLWTSADDPLLPSGKIGNPLSQSAIEEHFSPDGFTENNIYFSDNYQGNISIKKVDIEWKVCEDAYEIVQETGTIAENGWTAPSDFYEDSVVRYINPYDNNPGFFSGERGATYMVGEHQYNKEYWWYILKGNLNTPSTADPVARLSIEDGNSALPVPITYYTSSPLSDSIESTIKGIGGKWVDTVWSIPPLEPQQGGAISGETYRCYATIEGITQADTIVWDDTDPPWFFWDYDSIQVVFGGYNSGVFSDTISVYVTQDFNQLKNIFWEVGNSSNPWLDITNWNISLKYINGDTNRDLLVELPPELGDIADMLSESLIVYNGYGEGGLDYFTPFHFLSPYRAPKTYIEIDGNSEGKYYQLAYFDGKRMTSFTDIKPPVNDSVLGYLDVADLCGKIKLLMFLYTVGDTAPVAIRWKDTYIGDIINGGNLYAHSPFYRTEMMFANGSFVQDTLARVSMVPRDTVSMRLASNMFYSGDCFSPVIHLQPEGAKFSPGACPTLYYYLTPAETSYYEIKSNNVHLYAISTNGWFRDITKTVTVDVNGVMIIESEPDSFPRGSEEEGEYTFFSPFSESSTVSYKVLVDAPSSASGNSVMIKAMVPYTSLSIMVLRATPSDGSDSGSNIRSTGLNFTSASGDAPITIYDALALIKNTQPIRRRSLAFAPWTGWSIDTFAYYHLTDTANWIEIPIQDGLNKFWIGDSSALTFAVTNDSSIKIKNCPITGFDITGDNAGPSIVFVGNPEPTISYIDDVDTIRFFSTDSGKVYYTRFGLSGEIQDIREWDVMPEETLSVIWDGRTSTGDFTDVGLYPYIVYGVDIAGNRSAEYRHNWNVNWKVPVHIVYPGSGDWLRGTPQLLSTIDGGYQWSVQWQKKWGNYWGYIGMEEHSGNGLDWNTTNLPDERDVWLRVYCKDPYGFEGEASVLIGGIDNHPPVSSIGIEPYDKAINMGEYTAVDIANCPPPKKPKFIVTSEDTLSGIQKREYQWQYEWTTEYDDLWLTYNDFEPFQQWPEYEGRYTIFYRAEDNAGNIEEPKYLYVYLDSSGPQSELVFGQPSDWRDDTLYIAPNTPIHISAEDSSGVDSSCYSIWKYINEHHSIRILGWTEATDTFYFPDTEAEINTSYIIKIYSVDNFGHQEAIKDTIIKIMPDETPPVTEISIGNPNYQPPADSSQPTYIASETPITLTAMDDISGVDSIKWEIGTGNWEIVSDSITTFNLTGTDREYTIQYYSIDKAGNREEVKSIKLIVDNTSPGIFPDVGEPKFNEWVSDTTPINVSVNDTGCGVESSWIYVNGDKILSFTENTEFNLDIPEGNKEISIFAEDHLANTSSDTMRLKLDVSAPLSSVSFGEPHYPLNIDNLPIYITSQTPITLTATDNLSGVKQTEYYIDTGPFIIYNLPFTITGTDGIHTIYYHSIDNVNNTEAAKDTTIYLDNTPPISQISVGEPNYQGLYININTPITITATDNLSGVKQTEYAIDDTLDINTYTSQFTIPDEGIHHIYYRSRDNVENTEKWKVLEVRVDKTPSITQMEISNPSVNGYYITSSSPLILTAIDPISNNVASGVHFVKWEVGTENWEVNDTIATFNITGNDGEYTIRYYSIDNVQNTEAEKDTLVYLDNTPPTTDISIGNPKYQAVGGIYITSSSPLTLTSTDEGSGVDTIYYRIDNGEWMLAVDKTLTADRLPLTANQKVESLRLKVKGERNNELRMANDKSADSIVFTIPTEGIHTIEYYAIDKLGNTENIKNIELKVDNTSSISNLYLSEPEYESLYVTSNTEITIKSYDPISNGVASGVDSLKWEVGTEKWEVEDTITTFNITGADGTYFIDYYSIDNVENTEETKQDSVILDNTPPITGISFGNPRYQPTADSSQLYITSQTPIDLTATDNLSGVHFVKWKVGTENWEVEDSIATFNITGEDGIHTVYYHSIDNVQNTEATKDTTIYLDNTPPITEVTIGEPYYPLNPDSSQPTYITSQTPITLNVSDEGCGIQNAEYQIDNTGWVSYTDSTTFNLTSVGEGLHTLYYRSVDNLGNQEQTKTFLLAVDDTHPISSLAIGNPKYIYSGDSIIITSQTPETLSAYDPLSNGVASGVHFVKWEVGTEKWEVEDTITTFNITGKDTTYTIKYYSIDHLGNTEPENSQSVILDNTPPEVEIISPPDSTMVNQDIKIRGKVSDIHIAHWYLEYGQGDNPSIWTLLSEGTTDTTGIIGDWDTRTLTDGVYTLRLRAEDVVGNSVEDIHTILVGKPDFLFEITGLLCVKDVSADGNGNIYDVDRNKEIGEIFNRVAKFNPYGDLLTEWWGFHSPEGIALDRKGNFYITTMDKVLGISYNGDTIFSADGFYPKGIGVDSDRVITAERFKRRIIVYNKGGDTLYTIKHPLAPSGIDIYDNKIYATDLGINLFSVMEDSVLINWLYSHTPLDSFTVEEFKDSIFLREYGSTDSTFIYPFDLSVDKNGWVWVIETCQNRVRVYNRYGEDVLIFGEKGDSVGQFEYPQGIDVRSSKIYIADTYNDRIEVFGINFPTLLTIANKGAFASVIPLEIEYTVPWPNPATNISHIRVKINKDAVLRLKIYTLGGKIVWQTEQQGYEGINEIDWDLTNSSGEEVINGVYGYVIEAESGNEKVKAYEKIAIIK